jgi:hypothetical protein
MLIVEFCHAKNLVQPDLNELSLGCSSTSTTNLSQNNDSGHVSTNNSDNDDDECTNVDSDNHLEEDEEEEDEDEIHDSEMEEPAPSTSKSSEITTEKPAEEEPKEIEGISKDNWKLLSKVKTTQMQDHLKGKQRINSNVDINRFNMALLI